VVVWLTIESRLPASIVLFAHGARDAQWSEPFVRIRDHLRLAQPGVQIDVAYLQIMQPSLENAVAEHVASGVTHVLIAPLFFGQGGHLKEDLPLMVSRINAAHPDIVLQVTPAAGEVDELIALIARWVMQEFQGLFDDMSHAGPSQTG
jgi:sirohydrochlorin cobaltochelatase